MVETDLIGQLMPDYSRRVNIGYPLSDSKYTVPSHGWLFITLENGGTTSMNYYINNLKMSAIGTPNSYGYSLTIPVSKNDTFYLSYSSGSGNYFCPCKGV